MRHDTENSLTHEQTTAVWVGAFLDELVRWGVHDVVISPGSRSTPLAMVAYELNRQRPDDLRLYVDVDERGAAFFGLGMAKASGHPVALVCTSGTALANYYPAVIEAETSRVPLIVLSGDRPPRLQGLGAPQTTDQIKIFGDHVRAFRAMPLPSATARDISFVRQAAREACLFALGNAAIKDAAGGADAACGADATDAAGGVNALSQETDVQIASKACEHKAGAVHVNFPFDEPLLPDFSNDDVFNVGRSADVSRETSDSGYETITQVHSMLDSSTMSYPARLIHSKNTLVLAGEGTCSTLGEACEVVHWAHIYNIPILADPLSGLRTVDDELIIDNYDNVFAQSDCPVPDLVIRFGRYPVSKRATTRLADAHATQNMMSVVVDVAETRDFNYATDVFVPMTPLDFLRCMTDGSVAADRNNAVRGVGDQTTDNNAGADQQDFTRTWITLNDAARTRILSVSDNVASDRLEGAYLRKLFNLVPSGSCLFVANSLAIREIDTFFVKGSNPFCVLCNRGQNGIDGTISTALGAAQNFARMTCVLGDLACLHDLNALAMQRELLKRAVDRILSIVFVLFDNNGGAIFDTLPQASDDPYFERLFLTPQDVDFQHAAQAFNISYQRVSTVEEFGRIYTAQLSVPGISLIEISMPSRGVEERLNPYQK